MTAASIRLFAFAALSLAALSLVLPATLAAQPRAPDETGTGGDPASGDGTGSAPPDAPADPAVS